MSLICFLSIALLSLSALSKPLGTPVVAKRQTPNPTTPGTGLSSSCGDIVGASEKGFNVFYAAQVLECLESVPFNAAVALRFLEYYNQTLHFQSTLEYLKDPPVGYQQPPVDVDQVFSALKANVSAGVYPNQYAFEADVQLLVNRIHDTHVVLSAGALQPFSFLSPYGIVAASIDGIQPPDIYLTDHVIGCNPPACNPSPITHINGVEVVEYLTRYAEQNSQGYLEPHADWNALMDSPVRDILGDAGVFQQGTLYPGDDLKFTLRNGSSVDTYWLALFAAQQETGPLRVGGDFYNFFVLGLLPASYNETDVWWDTDPPKKNDSNENAPSNNGSVAPDCSSTSSNWSHVSLGGFPDNPTIAQQGLSIECDGVVSGYIFDNASLGVLSFPTFQQPKGSIDAFQNATQDFINDATARNLSRIIIDVRQNLGGSVFLAFQTFRKFFPTIDPYAASRIRSHHLANVLGNTYSEWWKQLEKNDHEVVAKFNYEYYAASEWVVINRINTETGTNFSSWEEYSGRRDSVVGRNDSFSVAQRYNLSDVIFDGSMFDNRIPFGYGSAKPQEPLSAFEHWTADEIVILTDGLCGSACALFVEMMSHQAGVRTIAVGGRPHAGPMQAVAGTRGARSSSADELDRDFKEVGENLQNEVVFNSLPNRSDSGMWVTYAGFNMADQMRQNDSMPLQFKYEAADCRLYYTLSNVYNVSRLWHDVAAAAWMDTALCVQDSTGYPTIRGAKADDSTKPPPARTAQTPILNYDLSKMSRTLVEVESPGDLLDYNGIGLSVDSITSVNSQGACPLKKKKYWAEQICGVNGHWSRQPVPVCFPSCRVQGGGTDGCPSHTACRDLIAVDTKSTSSYGARNAGGQPSGIYEGFCKPQKDWSGWDYLHSC